MQRDRGLLENAVSTPTQRCAKQLPTRACLDDIRPADRLKTVAAWFPGTHGRTGFHHGMDARTREHSDAGIRQPCIERNDRRLRTGFKSQSPDLRGNAHCQVVAMQNAPPSGNPADKRYPSLLASFHSHRACGTLETPQ